MTRTRQFLAALLVALLSLAAITAAPAPLLAQTQASQPDYTAWEKDAQGAEDTLAADRASSAALEKLRERIVTWRSSFGVSSVRSSTVVGSCGQ